ncbi:hypothetical protein L1049_001862 [Liquidambar formosana]|uniref:Transcription factor CBF/NF-Y/archaeal histone domain-containing protein n=1 Tax=Liquidambar formosana TaxID=63359 RepID=A0AAP0NEK1_LIQFO
MDLNQALEFTPSSTPQAQLHNFMPMPPLPLPPNYYQTIFEDSGVARECRLLQLQRHNLEIFWNQQLLEIHSISEFKNQYQLPLARIKRIMKTDGEVKMISADAPVLFSKACELFIMELTLRAWLHTEDNTRRILQRCDIARAIRHDNELDFLADVIPSDGPKLKKLEALDLRDHLVLFCSEESYVESNGDWST